MTTGKPEDPHFAALASDELWAEGLSLFNSEQYYVCHEALECLWNRQCEPEKQFTQGIIQIAVGLYHARRSNRVGALKLLPRGLARVRPFAPEHLSLDIDSFIRQVEECIELVDNPPAPSLRPVEQQKTSQTG